MHVSSELEYLMRIPLFVHSFNFVGNISFPISPLIIVDFPAFDGPKNGIKITL